MTYEDLIEQCRKLRARAERAESEFFIFLIKVEKEEKELLTANGVGHFHQFIRSNHLCEPHRYDEFCRGVERIGAEKALELGAAHTMRAGRLRDVSVLPDLERRTAAFIATEGVAPSELTVSGWCRELDTPPKTHSTVRRGDELNRLRAENKRLKVELATAQRRIRELEATKRKAS